MARIFITGSADGLGHLAAKLLVAQGHSVVLHARNTQRAEQAFEKIPQAVSALAADLSDMDQTIELAQKVNAIGRFDAIIHNAGVFQSTGTEIFAVNTLAPYILTCLIDKPERLVYMSSGMHMQGTPHIAELSAGLLQCNYSDSKLHNVILSMAVARKWQGVYSNSVNPGWVPTRMGGSNAPDDLQQGAETQAWLAVSNDENAKVSGRYFNHQQEVRYNSYADDKLVQDGFLAACEKISGVRFPAQ